MDNPEPLNSEYEPHTTSARYIPPATGSSALDTLRSDFDFSDMPNTEWLERKQPGKEPDTRTARPYLLPDLEHP